MRTHTTTTEVCTFEELTPEMQQKAIEKNYDIEIHYEWWGNCYDAIKEMAEFFGIETEQKTFCASWDYSPSFGMNSRLSLYHLRDALKSKPENGYKAQEDLFSLFGAWYKAAAKKVCPQTWKRISEGYAAPQASSRTRNTDASFETDADNSEECDRVAADLEILADLCEDVLQHICHYAAQMLREEYEYRTSEECIKECLIANQYEFEADGDGSIF